MCDVIFIQVLNFLDIHKYCYNNLTIMLHLQETPYKFLFLLGVQIIIPTLARVRSIL